MRKPPAAAKGQGVHDILSGEGRSDKLHHEDIEVGKPAVFGHKILTRDEIIAFGRAYDPQPMHIDEEAAKATPVGGLIASGWHTCAIMMRMLCDGPLGNIASQGSPGVEEARWRRPVRPDTVLTCRQVYTAKRDLASRPGVGAANITLELLDGQGEVLAWWRSIQLIRKRHPGAAQPAADRGSGAPRRPLASLWDSPPPPARTSRGMFFEDREIGETADFGRHTFTRDEIVAFAREFDPQPFHLDEAAAKASLFGGLCASGWHTAAMFIRGVVTHRLAGNAAGAAAPGERRPAYGPSPGFRELRWLRPVYVGDTIEFRSRLAEKIDMRSRPDRGILASEVQARNQKGEIVFSLVSQILADRREPYRA
jgi:acyl dehydratase